MDLTHRGRSTKARDPQDTDVPPPSNFLNELKNSVRNHV